MEKACCSCLEARTGPLPDRDGWRGSKLLMLCAVFVGMCLAVASGSSCYAAAPIGATPIFVEYLPGYKPVGFALLAKTIDFHKVTHVNLAFGNPPKCDGVCTASSNMNFSVKGQTDADVTAVVMAAHQAHAKVLLSIGGGGGDQLIIPFYNAGLSVPLIASLDRYMKAHDIDGVDVDIEDPSSMGAPFASFVAALVATFHPEGKLVTAAVAKYMQNSMPDAALHQFDFINVMVYSSLAAATDALQFYSIEKKVPRSEIVLGLPFFGSNLLDSKEEDYATILAAYPNAWRIDTVSGGPMDDGQIFHYVGEETMAQETLLGKQFGGVMIWEITGDAPAPHSLLSIVKNNL
jgi:chitinase